METFKAELKKIETNKNSEDKHLPELFNDNLITFHFESVEDCKSMIHEMMKVAQQKGCTSWHYCCCGKGFMAQKDDKYLINIKGYD